MCPVPWPMRVNLADDAESKLDGHVRDFIEQPCLDIEVIRFFNYPSPSQGNQMFDLAYAIAASPEPKHTPLTASGSVLRHLPQGRLQSRLRQNPPSDYREVSVTHGCRP